MASIQYWKKRGQEGEVKPSLNRKRIVPLGLTDDEVALMNQEFLEGGSRAKAVKDSGGLCLMMSNHANALYVSTVLEWHGLDFGVLIRPNGRFKNERWVIWTLVKR